MYNRFNDSVVSLKGLRKIIGKVEINRKLLSSLPKDRHPKVITIDEAKNLEEMTIKELFGLS